MKKLLSVFGILFLLFALSTATVYAAKPVDNDNDGHRSNVDCNDDDPLINPDATEVCDDGVDNNCDGFVDSADPTCGGGTVDNDSDGYDSSVDCNDDDPAVNPGATEICDDGIDNDCSGGDEVCGGGTCSSYTDKGSCVNDASCEWIGNPKNGYCQDLPGGSTDNDGDGYDDTVDCNDNDPAINPGATEICDDGIDQNCDPSDDNICDPVDPNHGSLTWSDYPTACLTCHGTQYNEMANSTHYKWVGDTTEMVNQNGTQQGKLTNAVNSYCINILGDWKICGKCHVGRGLRPDDQAAGLENIDCLMCHNQDYALARDRQPDGSMAPAVGLDSYVQNVAKPTTTSCLKCHAYAGGGDAVKRGDLSSTTMTNTSANFDVHMNTSASDVQCQECHVFQNHKTIGRGSDLRPTDDTGRGSEINCSTCHVGMDVPGGHAAAGANRVDADRHVEHVSCQACHIDVYGKDATEMHRDWRDTSHHGAAAPYHPGSTKASDVTPEFKFWNRLSDNYLLGDPAVVDPATGFYPTSRPMGDINDGKLYPFKYKTADQPMADGKLVALDTLVYIGQTGDPAQSTESGLVNMGYPSSEPYTWVTTDTYQLLNHGVAPASAVDCSKCHNNFSDSNDNMLDQLGYKLKDVPSLICAQCHSEKSFKRTNEQMHAHLQKGAGMDCLFCHSFSRQLEKGGIGPCDSNASDFVDGTPYNHPECN